MVFSQSSSVGLTLPSLASPEGGHQLLGNPFVTFHGLSWNCQLLLHGGVNPKLEVARDACTLFLEMWNKGRHSRAAPVSIPLAYQCNHHFSLTLFLQGTADSAKRLWCCESSKAEAPAKQSPTCRFCEANPLQNPCATAPEPGFYPLTSISCQNRRYWHLLDHQLNTSCAVGLSAGTDMLGKVFLS